MSLLESRPPEGDDSDHSETVAQDFSYGLGPGINVSLTRRGPELLVSFGDDDRIAKICNDMDWSILRVDADDPRDFLGDLVVGFFDALLDSTLLDEFDDVLFVGSGAATAATLGYSICVPMARVLIIGPEGPIPDVGRFAPSARNLAVAETIQVLFDPRDGRMSADAQTIASRGATLLPIRFGAPGDLVHALEDLGALDEILEDAVAGQLSDRAFFQALRARRRNNGYLRRLIARLVTKDRDVLRALVLRYIGTRQGRKRYLSQYEKLSEDLATRGISVPASRD